MIEPDRGALGRGGVGTDLHDGEIVMILPGRREEDHLAAEARDLAQAEHVPIERHRTLQASDFEDHVADATDLDGVGHAVMIHAESSAARRAIR